MFFQEQWDTLVNGIIRPPRLNYSSDSLGPETFKCGGLPVRRVDISLTNPRGHKIVGSFWGLDRDHLTPAPCVVYCHGNGSARVEALDILRSMLSRGIQVCAFDFSGSGQSEGKWVSLGAYEKDDLKTIVEHLRHSHRVTSVAVWGRSMGAATALLYTQDDPMIAGLILDSPYSDLKQLASELCQMGAFPIPTWAVSMALPFVQSSIQERARFDLYDCSPIFCVGKIFVPAVFACARNDTFIQPDHVFRLFKAHGGWKSLSVFDGDHVSRRPRKFQLFATAVLLDCFGLPKPAELESYLGDLAGIANMDFLDPSQLDQRPTVLNISPTPSVPPSKASSVCASAKYIIQN